MGTTGSRKGWFIALAFTFASVMGLVFSRRAFTTQVDTASAKPIGCEVEPADTAQRRRPLFLRPVGGGGRRHEQQPHPGNGVVVRPREPNGRRQLAHEQDLSLRHVRIGHQFHPIVGKWFDHGPVLNEVQFSWSNQTNHLWAPDIQTFGNELWLYVPDQDKGGIFRVGMAHASISNGIYADTGFTVETNTYLQIANMPVTSTTGWMFDPGVFNDQVNHPTPAPMSSMPIRPSALTTIWRSRGSTAITDRALISGKSSLPSAMP